MADGPPAPAAAPAPAPPALPPRQPGDAAVQLTNDDACGSKWSAVQKGYFRDDFLGHFVGRRRPAKRPPLIHRGYYARVAAVRGLVRRFAAAADGGAAGGGAAGGSAGGPRAQVLSLGAGFDTTFWHLATSEGLALARWVELDFVDVVVKKAAIIAATPALQPALGAPAVPVPAAAPAADAADAAGPAGAGEARAVGGPGVPPGVTYDRARGSLLAPRYGLQPADLRSPASVLAAAAAAGLDPALPTLILAECVLVYLPPAATEALLARLVSTLSCCMVMIYEPIRPDDPFGQQMVTNLEARGCPLLGLRGCPDLRAQTARLRAAGFARAEAADMEYVYAAVCQAAEVRAIERLEPLDELEEWRLFMQHYVLALGFKDDSNPGPGLLSGLSFSALAGEPPGSGGPAERTIREWAPAGGAAAAGSWPGGRGPLNGL